MTGAAGLHSSNLPLSSGSGPAVVLFGEVLADIFPQQEVLGGAPFNVAHHLRAFGLHPVLITRVGNDALRGRIFAAMEQAGMDVRGVQCDPVLQTGRVQVHQEKDGHHFEILPDQAYDHIHTGVARLTALSAQPALVYFGTLAQRHAVSRRALNAVLRSVSAPCLLDINLRAPWYDGQTIRRSLQQADILKLNAGELAQLATLLRLPKRDPRGLAAELIERFALQSVLVTCAEEGAWLLNPDGTQAEVGPPEEPVRIVDTVGAGDGFASVFILGLLSNWPVPLTLARADVFARALCGVRGAIPENAGFYAPFLHEWKMERANHA